VDNEGPGLLVRCPAKLNLFLEVVRRRPDGYHDIDTVMQAIDLYDDLRILPRSGRALTLECDDPSLPAGAENLVVRAATALRDHAGGGAGAHLVLRKRIPVQAGLGGGSSDAAGALVGLNLLWNLGLGVDALHAVAATVGSDVPFFLHGGAARCTGRGEHVEPLVVPAGQHYVLLFPPLAVSTAEAYKRLRLPLTSAGASASMLVKCLAEGHIERLGRCLFNRLEEPAGEMHPELLDAKSRLEATGLLAGVGMTGSGSALFGVCWAESWDRACEGVAALRLGDAYGVRGIALGVHAQPE